MRLGQEQGGDVRPAGQPRRPQWRHDGACRRASLARLSAAGRDARAARPHRRAGLDAAGARGGAAACGHDRPGQASADHRARARGRHRRLEQRADRPCGEALWPLRRPPVREPAAEHQRCARDGRAAAGGGGAAQGGGAQADPRRALGHLPRACAGRDARGRGRPPARGGAGVVHQPHGAPALLRDLPRHGDPRHLAPRARGRRAARRKFSRQPRFPRAAARVGACAAREARCHQHAAAAAVPHPLARQALHGRAGRHLVAARRRRSQLVVLLARLASRRLGGE
mmetsp:Transcript_36551/g.108579  ORF Transcript_36551/g.108579 Transcript_36551/m.108579 type:complete len:284 (-) Transcript_36551:2165-3016(-)